jgi:hypothetical protein
MELEDRPDTGGERTSCTCSSPYPALQGWADEMEKTVARLQRQIDGMTGKISALERDLTRLSASASTSLGFGGLIR